MPHAIRGQSISLSCKTPLDGVLCERKDMHFSLSSYIARHPCLLLYQICESILPGSQYDLRESSTSALEGSISRHTVAS